MTGSGRTVAGATLAIATLLGVMSCGGGWSSAPQSLPPLASSPSASPSPTSAASSPPTAGRKHTEVAAATAVVRRYYSLLTRIANHANPESFASLMTPACTCRRFVRVIRHLRARHEHFFGRARLLAVRPAFDNPAETEVLVTYDATRGGIATASGHVVSNTRPLTRASLDYDLRKENGRWLIDNVVVVDPGTP